MEKPLGKSDLKLEVDHFILPKFVFDNNRANLKTYFIDHLLG